MCRCCTLHHTLIRLRQAIWLATAVLSARCAGGLPIAPTADMIRRMLLPVSAMVLAWIAGSRPGAAPPSTVLAAQDAEAPRRLGPDLHAPRVRRKIEPQYTEAAREAKLEGAVLLDGVVTADGMLTALRVRRGLGLGLDERALEAAASWQFEPARTRRDNVPVPVRVTIEVHFRLL